MLGNFYTCLDVDVLDKLWHLQNVSHVFIA